MKKILSLSLVVLMLFCMIPFTVSAAYVGDTLPGLEVLPGYFYRLAEFNIDTGVGHYNANSGQVITTGDFVTAANALNIADGFQGVITVRVYNATNEVAASQVFNHYVGVVYWNGNLVSPSFYPLGDLLTVIYNSLEYAGNTPTAIKWDALSFVSTSFATEQIIGGVLNGSSYNWIADWDCTDHSFGADGKCTVCGEQMQASYVVGDYTYTVIGENIHGLGVAAGWMVTANDKTKTSYGEIRNTLHSFPVTLMYKTFEGCTNMTTAPAVPANVMVVYNAYKGTAITATPAMTNGVVKLYGAFKNCKNLTYAEIPASVTNLTGAFKGCTALTDLPDISAVTDLTEAFDGCTSLRGTVVLSTSDNDKAFRNTAITSATINTDSIQQSCFSGSALKTIVYNGTMDQWESVQVGAYNAAVKTANIDLSSPVDASVTVKNGVTYVSGLDNAKDFFIANGTQSTYREVANNKLLGVTSAKFGSADVYAYGAALAAGNYTLCIRNYNGTNEIVNFTVA